MESRHGIVEHTLHPNYEGRIMLLRGANGRMAEQELYGAEIGAVLEQGDRERIPEPVRMAVRHAGPPDCRIGSVFT